jgi:hypothetical protein
MESMFCPDTGGKACFFICSLSGSWGHYRSL